MYARKSVENNWVDFDRSRHAWAAGSAWRGAPGSRLARRCRSPDPRFQDLTQQIRNEIW